MKTFISILILFSSFAGAVTVKNCPQNMTVTYEAFQVYGEKKVVAEVKRQGFDFNTSSEIPKVYAKLKSVPSFAFQEIEMTLVSRDDSRCTYMSSNAGGPRGHNETRLFTRKGRDILRVALNINGEYFWTYHSVNAYSPEAVELKNLSSKVLGYFDHGSPRFPMAWASDVDVSIE